MRTWRLMLCVVLVLGVSGCSQGSTDGQAARSASTSPSAAPSDAPKLVGCNAGPSVPFTAVTVQSPGTGAELAVGVAGEGPVGVVIANTLVGYHCDWLVWADHLAKSGFRVAVFEYGFIPRTVGVPAMLDHGSGEMIAVGEELRKLGAQKIVYAGGSLGGSVALATAADPAARAAGVISLSGGLDGQQDTVRRLTVPAIYVVAEDDFTGGAANLAKELHKATTGSSLAVYPGAQHAGEMFGDERYADELLAKLDAFLRAV